MAIALGILFSAVVVLHPLIVHLIAAVLLCLSGLFTNLVQALCLICIYPISENIYTRINRVVKQFDWRVLIGIINWWAGLVMIQDCTEQETSHLKGEEHELIILNARNDADHLGDLILAQWSGFLGILVAVVKTSASPVKGWSMWISESVFSRSCVHDSDLEDFLQPFWLSVVLERTGFTQGDLRAAQRLPVSSKVLSSDTKDLVYAVRCVDSAVPDIYILTVAIPKTSPALTLESVIKGGHSVVHVYIKRHETKKWPETDDAVEKWYTEILPAKNALLDDHIVEHTFGDKRLQAIGWPLKCLLVVISLIVLWALKLNFVCCSTLLILSAALLTGRMLALFGCGLLSMLQCLMGAAIARITWADHLKPICDVLIPIVCESISVCPFGTVDCL